MAVRTYSLVVLVGDLLNGDLLQEPVHVLLHGLGSLVVREQCLVPKLRDGAVAVEFA